MFLQKTEICDIIKIDRIDREGTMKHQITVLPKNKIIYADEGALLLDVLRQNGFYLPAACGGKGTCGKCKVHLIAGAVEGTKPDADGMILSCHARVCSP